MALDIEEKFDSTEKLAAIAGKPTKNYLFANEVNQIVSAVKELEILVEQNSLTPENFGAFSNGLKTEDDISDSDKINFTDSSDTNNQKKTTWLNIKAKLIKVLNALFVSKVSTVDVEKVYIKNADGTQGVKPVSELLSEILITNASVSGTYNIDYSAGDVWRLTFVGPTILTESNVPTSGKTKTITINGNGNFPITYPAAYTGFITGEYKGAATLNTITVQTLGADRKVLIVQPT